MNKQLVVNDTKFDYRLQRVDSNLVRVWVSDICYEYQLLYKEANYLVLSDGKQQIKVYTSTKGPFSFAGRDFQVENSLTGRKSLNSHDHGKMVAPMPGKVLKVMCQVGDTVKKGDALLIMEAMKMEHTIKADQDGSVESIVYSVDDQVPAGAELVVLKD